MKRAILSVLLVLIVAFDMSARPIGHYAMDVTNKCIPVSQVDTYFNQWFSVDDNVSFEKIRTVVDGFGVEHISYQQFYRNEIVDGGMVIVHARDGFVQLVTASVMEKNQQAFVDSEIQLKREDLCSENILCVPVTTSNGICYRRAIKHIDESNRRISYIDIETGEIVKIEDQIYYGMVSDSVFTRYNGWQLMDSYYDKKLYYLYDTKRNIYTYNASSAVFSGEVVDYRNESDSITSVSSKWSAMLSNINVSCTDNSDWYHEIGEGDPDLFVRVFSSGGVELCKTQHENGFLEREFSDLQVQVDKGSYIVVYDHDTFKDDIGDTIYIESLSSGTYSWNGENTYGQIVLEGNPAVSAHWGMQKVYDFYKENFDLTGYNNLGTYIYQFVDPYGISNTHNLANAYSSNDNNGVGFMCYGLGNQEFDAFVSLDIIAHEYTHLVISFNGNGGLTYSGESGALNESFADIMACAIEHYAIGDSSNYEIGENIDKNYSNIRSLKYPKEGRNGLMQQPDTYKGDYWVDVSSRELDNGGVHSNSGVQNKWFYLLCEGGSGENDNGYNYNVEGIGIEKAHKIAFYTLRYYLTKNSLYWDAYEGSLFSAQNLYGKNSVEYQSVLNAWHAVGLGIDYTETKPVYVVVGTPQLDSTGYVLGSSLYAKGDIAKLEAVPKDGYVFKQWNDGNMDNPREFVVNDTVSIFAVFVLEHIDRSSLEDVYMDVREPVVKVQNGKIMIDGDGNNTIAIYSMAGQCVYRKKNMQMAEIDVFPGVYIVQYGDCTKKMVVR